MTPEPRDGFTWTSEPWGRGLRLDALSPVASHIFTTRDLFLAPFGQSERDGWDALAASIGATGRQLFRVRQVHSAIVYEPDRDRRPPETVDADALISGDPEEALSVRVADCVPILLGDRRKGLVAAVHSGWRGAAAGVAEATVRALAARGARPDDLIAAVGPSIGPCCYDVGEELVGQFTGLAAIGQWFVRSEARLRLDLWSATRDQLVSAGLKPGNVHVAGLCTACHPALFHSFRRDGHQAGRLAAVIRSGSAGLRPSPDSPADPLRG